MVSRYLILLLLNTPFIVAGLTNALVNFKLKKISRRRFAYQALIWLLLFAGLASAKPIYEFLFSRNLTRTEPLSLFDVIQITGIIAVIFVAYRTRAKLESLEHRVRDLHQELSIKLSEDKRSNKQD